MIRPIVIGSSHETLLKIATSVDKTKPEEWNKARSVIKDLFDTMYHYDHCIGLAAPQIGISLRIVVVNLIERPGDFHVVVDGERLDSPEDFKTLVLINPVITQLTGEMSVASEGCMSLPGVRRNVARPEIIRVEALGEAGEPLVFGCDGILARVIQHEVDHLDGVLLTNKINLKP